MSGSITKQINLLRNGTFCKFLVINNLKTLTMHILEVLLPLFVHERFTNVHGVVIAEVLLKLSKVFFAPVIGKVLLKKDPVNVARFTTTGLGGICLSLPQIMFYSLFKIFIIIKGFLAVGAITSFLILRSRVIPKGQNVEANSIFGLTTRLFRLLAPVLVG
jgi:hypothetical protein